MNRREILISSLCAALPVEAFSSNRAASYSSHDQSLGDGCVISTDGSSCADGQRTAVIVLGRCDFAIPEITRLGVSSTLAYFGGSTFGPNAEAYFAEWWNAGSELIRKVENTQGFIEWVAENHDRVAILGNFSAPFACRMLGLIAEKARRASVAVFAIGAVPSAGAEGLVRTQRGLNCIANLLQLGCCAITVPEVDFGLDFVDGADSFAGSINLGVNDGSPYCRALELALDEVQYSAASFENDLMQDTFACGRLVSLGWGYCGHGNAELATRMALANDGMFTKGKVGPTQVLVTSNDGRILNQLLASTNVVWSSISIDSSINFAADQCRVDERQSVQVIIFQQDDASQVGTR